MEPLESPICAKNVRRQMPQQILWGFVTNAHIRILTGIGRLDGSSRSAPENHRDSAACGS